MRCRARVATALVVLTSALSSACFVRSLAVGGLSQAFAGSAETFAREDDPELVRDALPFVLKAMEAVLLEDPENEELLTSACAAFGLYASAFVQVDAEELQTSDYAKSTALQQRALALYLRARDYGLRGLELRHPGIGADLRANPSEAVAVLEPADLELAFYTGGTWGLAIAHGKDDPALLADVDAVRALLRRALELDERFGAGAVHEAMISIEALPRVMGGSPERAREHYQRALELSGGHRASVYLSLAENLAVPAQDRAEFERALQQALAVDLDAAPNQRLSNRISQARARFLLQRIDELFLSP